MLNIITALEASEATRRVLTLTTVSFFVLHLFAVAFRIVRTVIIESTPVSARTSSEWITSVVRIVMVVLALVSVLEIWGVNISATVAGFGVLGAGLAIALQDFVQNLTAGLTNAAERRFRKGDWIEAEGVEGVVEYIDLRSTTVMGFDRVPNFVPNRALSEAVLKNKNRIDAYRIYWTVPLVMEARNDQIETICRAIRTYVENSDDFITDGSRTYIVLATGLSEDGVEVMIYVYSATAQWKTWLEIQSRLLMAIRDSVDTAGTKFAYRTGTIHLNIGEDITVRASVHSGECLRRINDITGLAVTIAARILELVPGGEVWVSGIVKGLVVGSGLQFELMGERQLKGIEDQWPLYRIDD